MSHPRLRLRARLALVSAGPAFTTLSFFAVAASSTRAQLAGLGALIGAEIIAVAGLIFSDSSSPPSARAQGRLWPPIFFLAYLAAAALTALFFIRGTDNSLKWLLAQEIAWLGLLAAALALWFVFSRSAADPNQPPNPALQPRQLEAGLILLIGLEPAAPWVPQLTQLVDHLKFTDHIYSVPTDALIAARIAALTALLRTPGRDRSELSDEVLAQVRILKNLIARRSAEAGLLSRQALLR
ncbi:MAG: hypothetical protein LBV21_06765 [Candidatus Adiutrix sp.]|nr:hypothetical protein [Candidatus Adiutrix sp.]